MTTTWVELPLYDDACYSYTTGVEGITIKLEFIFIERTSRYIMSVSLDDDTTVVKGCALVARYPMLGYYVLNDFGLSGYFMMLPKSANTAMADVTTTTGIYSKYQLYYVYESS